MNDITLKLEKTFDGSTWAVWLLVDGSKRRLMLERKTRTEAIEYLQNIYSVIFELEGKR